MRRSIVWEKFLRFCRFQFENGVTSHFESLQPVGKKLFCFFIENSVYEPDNIIIDATEDKVYPFLSTRTCVPPSLLSGGSRIKSPSPTCSYSLE